ncbi:TonB-dependent receptor [Kaistella anthropi]|nr:TonB-dependent receptor [Kaistella anthropi]
MPGATADFGSQRSSVANELDQDIFEITDNFKLNIGKTIVTLGTHNEFFSFRNLFINNYNGAWNFANLEDYLNNKPKRVQVGYSLLPDNDKPAAEFNAMQLGFYAQGDSEVMSKLRVTYGLRLDIPLMPDKPLRNEKIEKTFLGYRTDITPSGKLLWSPRLGFNYNVNGDKSLILRGGVGLFTGRIPFVWLSNQFTNSGMLFGAVNVNGDKDPSLINNGKGFDPNVANQKTWVELIKQ